MKKEILNKMNLLTIFSIQIFSNGCGFFELTEMLFIRLSAGGLIAYKKQTR